MNARKKTIAQQREHVAETRPAIALVPSTDDPAEQHGKASDERCGASGLFSGERLVCGLEARHGGMHQCAGRYWRPRSGDE
jgi:hypothetical protein